MNRIVSIGVVGLFSALAMQSHAQPCLRWFQRVPLMHPEAGAGMAMAFDSARNRHVYYNGSLVPGRPETWEWDGMNWVLAHSGVPPERGFHAMSYDARRAVAVLFGGETALTHSSETWEWSGSVWQQRGLIPRPPGRASHALAYDFARGVTVMFGGIDVDNNIVYGDTWEYDGELWTKVTAGGPLPRYDHAIAYDSRRGVTVLFGGFDFPTVYGDTWEWDGQSWTQRPSEQPRATGG